MTKKSQGGRPRQYVTVDFATIALPDGFALVYRAAQQAGLRPRAYIRDRVLAAARTELAQARRAQAAVKRPA